jgi:hypothetical protein
LTSLRIVTATPIVSCAVAAETPPHASSAKAHTTFAGLKKGTLLMEKIIQNSLLLSKNDPPAFAVKLSSFVKIFPVSSTFTTIDGRLPAAR